MKVDMRIALAIACVLTTAGLVPMATATHWLPDCPHNLPHIHTYGAGASVGARSDQVTGGDEVGAGVVTVSETNAVDCNRNGTPGDYDGDWETGIGGGFFGHGPWAHEPTCDFGLTEHGAAVTVFDHAFGSNIAFVIGADDTNGPTSSCTTDGSITPCDPAGCGPTGDPDDCLTQVFIGSGTTCGAGGDGGYWVFLNGAVVTEGAGGVGTAGNPPTAGTITA